MRLILVRHGEANAGFHGPIAGRTGCGGLTPFGRRQAEALRDHLAETGRIQAQALIASVIPRAIETAQIIAPGLGLELGSQDCDLCEVHTGDADGTDWADYPDTFGAFDMEAEPDRPFAPNGDSWNSFHERVQGALDRLAREYAGRTVVVVCHAGVIMASMRLLLGVPQPWTGAQMRPTNTGLTEWAYDGPLDRWTLHSFNLADHLLGLDREAARLRIGRSGYRAPMTAAHPYSVDSARAASERDELAPWVAEFLASPGSDNPVLAEMLAQRPDSWLGPIELPFDHLHRLAGPSGAPVLEEVEEHEWRDDVEDLKERVEEGWEPPPLIVTYRDDQLVVEDGNHRIEGMRRAGVDRAWSIVNFEDPSERDRFEVPPFDDATATDG